MIIATASVQRMRVLIVRLGAFGDIIHTLPLAADLTAAGHEVSWLCEDRWTQILAGSGAVRALVAFPRTILRARVTPVSAKLLALRRLTRELRDGCYDAVIDAQGLAKSALLAAASGARVRIGHARPRAREGSWIVARRRTPTQAVHVIDQQRSLALPLGVRARGGWRFPLPAWAEPRTWADDWLAQRRLEGPWLLNVGAGWPTKVWPEARQADLLRLLRERGRSVVVAWGSDAERAAAERVVAAASHGVLAPPTTIPQLAGVIARAAVVISGDTGPLHLALALGTPAVGLFGPVPAERNGPRGNRYRTIQAPGAAWERRDVSKVDMGSITAEAVIERAQAALADAG